MPFALNNALRFALAVALAAAVAACGGGTGSSSSGSPGSGSPDLALSTTSLNFAAPQGGADPTAQTVTASNAGGGTLAAPTATANSSGWLKQPAVNGTAAPYSIVVQASVTGLAAGVYHGSITVQCAGATNGTQSIAVTLTVGSATQPTMALSATALSFDGIVGGADPAVQTVTVENVGVGTLATPGTTITPGNASWLTATVSGSAAPYTITVGASLTGLAAGTYHANVSIACAGASNTPQSVAVTFTVTNPAQPTMQVSPLALSFAAPAGGADPGAQDVTVTNVGGGTLAVPTATPSAGWLTATVSGTAAPYTVHVQPSIAGLAPGTHMATISIASSGASNAPQTIAVQLVIGSATQPTMVLTPAMLTFSASAGGADPAAQTVSVTNAGAGNLAVPTIQVTYVGQQQNWLTVTVSGTTAPYTLTVQPHVGALATGHYLATVTVTSPGASNSPQTLAVQFTVN